MTLDHHLDYGIKVCTETEYKTLYKWCIREFDKDGNQVGLDQVPWGWTQRFGVTNLRYVYSVEHEDRHIPGLHPDEDADEALKKKISTKSEELIFADLSPVDSSSGSFFPTSYSMFGTNRRIENFSLRLVPYDEEFCSVYGGVSYTSEIDFRDETQDDLLQIAIGISPDRFERLRDLIETKSVTQVFISLNRVAGFYSEWSPSISTNSIKVLASAADQKLVIPDGCKIRPLETGRVGEFKIEFTKSEKLKSKGDELDEAHLNDGLNETELLEQLNVEDDIQAKVLRALMLDMKSAIKRATLPLWIMSFLLLLILLS